MSTLIRPELSETNRYWIEKHRYYELKHFCLQYPLWRHAYNSLIDYPGSWPQLVPPCKTNVVSILCVYRNTLISPLCCRRSKAPGRTPR